jgi:hypothetical protein
MKELPETSLKTLKTSKEAGFLVIQAALLEINYEKYILFKQGKRREY